MQSNSYKHCICRVITVLICAILSACQTAPHTSTVTEDSTQALYVQANKSLTAGDTDLAIKQFEQVLKQDPSARQAYTNLGLLYINKNDTASAKQAFINAIKQDKNDAIAYNHLAVIQRQQGEFQQALLNYEKAIDADPDYANAHLNLGILYDIYLQELPKAVVQYEKYQQLTNNSNEKVEKWLIDINRRMDNKKEKSK